MAENSAGSPVFAGRYKFQTVSNDWDKGRSGFTHLVFDIQKERLGVMKRAELKSQQAVDNLKNEMSALLDLKGEGVPELYDTGEAEYGSKKYLYMVIEYIDGIRIEKNLDSLSAHERAEILAQFFGLLAKAHKMGIVNGDVDLKHLFWRKDKKQLVVIDWGNAKLDVDLKKKNNFAYDMARSAEIIYALTTRKGHPPATGSLALPNESARFPGLAPLPFEFYNLCKWAPRTPVDGIQSPYTALEILNSAITIQKLSLTKTVKKQAWSLRVFPIFAFLLAITGASILSRYPNSLLYPLLYPRTPTPLSTVILSSTLTPRITETETPTKTQSPKATATELLAPTSTFISSSATPPLSKTYDNPILVFNNHTSTIKCWDNGTNSELLLSPSEGFTTRDDNNFGFTIQKDRTIGDLIQADFSQCIEGKPIVAMALNAWVTRLDIERQSPNNPGILDPGKEFGIFIEYEKNQRREYTIWIDKNESMHLRVRENNEIILDDTVFIVDRNNLRIKGAFPRLYSEFPVQIFFEINNQGLDILHIRQGPGQMSVSVNDFEISKMPQIDEATLPTLGTMLKIGLIGYGGDTRIVIWPLVFFGE